MSTAITEKYVYLDYAATAPLCEEAACAMAPYQLSGRASMAVAGNANSLHRPGRAAFQAFEIARKSLACDVGAARPDEVLCMSGATEADNAAVLGIARAAVKARKISAPMALPPQVITTAVEHDAVLAPCAKLEAEGFRVTRLIPNREGFIDPEVLESALDADTVLVSVQAANSEVGSIQPIAHLVSLAHACGALFHTDAVQALGKIPLNLNEWGVDAASFSAHKIGGPKGVGALYLKTQTPFEPFMCGGGQEGGRRSGTQNVAGMVGFAAALHAVCKAQVSEAARLTVLRDRLYAKLLAIPRIQASVKVPHASAHFLPTIVHILVEGFESETLILRLDELGFGVSGGSACASHSLEPSHVLRALGIDDYRAQGALRISLGRYTTKDDIDAFVDALIASLKWN